MTMRDQVELLELMKQFDLEKECNGECWNDCVYAAKYEVGVLRSCPIKSAIEMLKDRIYKPGKYKNCIPREGKNK